ncbi:MAG: histidine phosphatase family protein, partial [Candidatus Aenigmatarchaeota archaeon]
LGFSDHKVIQDKRLREIDYGDFTGLPCSQFKPHMLDYVDKPFPNGESYEDVKRRIMSFLQEIKREYAGNIAVIAHHAPQLALDVLLKGRTWEEAITEDWRTKNAWQPGWDYILE